MLSSEFVGLDLGLELNAVRFGGSLVRLSFRSLALHNGHRVLDSVLILALLGEGFPCHHGLLRLRLASASDVEFGHADLADLSLFTGALPRPSFRLLSIAAGPKFVDLSLLVLGLFLLGEELGLASLVLLGQICFLLLPSGDRSVLLGLVEANGFLFLALPDLSVLFAANSFFVCSDHLDAGLFYFYLALLRGHSVLFLVLGDQGEHLLVLLLYGLLGDHLLLLTHSNLLNNDFSVGNALGSLFFLD
mmetsp:Transcript_6067/g.17708  ORF Transcript_6067/g.17708 Transcript_6067/m.17708 type:complete len:247 (+) Transcript_6067:467-1207(+)